MEIYQLQHEKYVQSI